jgi:hypothetical protein
VSRRRRQETGDRRQERPLVSRPLSLAPRPRVWQLHADQREAVLDAVIVLGIVELWLARCAPGAVIHDADGLRGPIALVAATRRVLAGWREADVPGALDAAASDPGLCTCRDASSACGACLAAGARRSPEE